MGIISVEKADHLFWLGRYSERVFTTLESFFKYFDKMLDEDHEAYKQYCAKIGVPMVYTDMDDFIGSYVFSGADPNSIYSNMLRAYDNGVVLRGDLGSITLSYIHICIDRFVNNRKDVGLQYQLQPIMDYLYAFWGCLDDHVEDEEARNIIKCGRYLERLDLYTRLGYSYASVEKEYRKLTNRLGKVRIAYSQAQMDRLGELLAMGEEAFEANRPEIMQAVWSIF